MYRFKFCLSVTLNAVTVFLFLSPNPEKENINFKKQTLKPKIVKLSERIL